MNLPELPMRHNIPCAPLERPMPPTAEQFRKVLSYDESTGHFRWLVQRGPVKAGAAAGSKLGDYLSIRVFGKTYLSHRIAVLVVTGEWPTKGMDVDHIDGNKLNNAWANLRVVDKRTNNQNLRRARTGSRSGLIGAHWDGSVNKWLAGIRINGRNTYIGRFDTPEEAHAAYIAAKRQFHAGCTI